MLEIIPDAGHSLPRDWRRQTLDAVLDRGEHVVRVGPAAGSEESAGLDYRVLTTDKVAERLPWLMTWYRGPGLKYARRFDRSVECVGGLAAVNVNLVIGCGGDYEWHRDSQSHTMILFASTLQDGDGGELELRLPQGTRGLVPSAGLAAIFDSACITHRVAPLRRDVVRVSIPLQYIVPGQPERDSLLNRDLFNRDE